jgi:biopolymer transport protein ExbD
MWDVFHADRLELERGLSTETIRQALAQGNLQDDDLVRPAGTNVPWARIADFPELTAPPAVATEPESARGVPESCLPSHAPHLSDFEEIQPELAEASPPDDSPHEPSDLPGPSSASDVAFPVFEEPASPQPPAPPPSALPESPQAWAWEDEEDDEDDFDDESDEDDALADDLEVVDDSGLGESEATPGAAGMAGDADALIPNDRPPLPDERPIVERWELTEDDLVLDDDRDSRSSHVALPVAHSKDRDDPFPDARHHVDEGEEGDFSLQRSATQKIEELDLAPMVDVAFQLVLFFMVTATTVLYKTLEIPKPSAEPPAGAVAQGRSRNLDELKEDYILVEIDDQGAMKLDREPIEPTMETLVERLRTEREKTGRKAMLLSADFKTPHRNSVLAYDAANEIGMGIAIAKPEAPQGPPPALRAAPAPPRAEPPAPTL